MRCLAGDRDASEVLKNWRHMAGTAPGKINAAKVGLLRKLGGQLRHERHADGGPWRS
jgi:hypothetical protein